MNEREMLMFAAKAAGYNVEFDYYGQDRHARWTDKIRIPPVLWMPRTDYGDALRMAVKLELIVDAFHDRAMPSRRHAVGHRDWVYGDDVFDAIIKCAAEIGKAMP